MIAGQVPAALTTSSPVAAAASDQSATTTATAAHTNTRTPDSLDRARASAPSAAQRAQIITDYGRLPMAFEPTADATNFVARGDGYTITTSAAGPTLWLRTPVAPITDGDALVGWPDAARWTATPIQMRLIGADPAVTGIGADALSGHVNYLIGNDRASWRTNVPTFSKVRYDNVWPGIDLAYYGKQKQLEFDVALHPGADLTHVGLAFDGATTLRLGDSGDLLIGVGGGVITLLRPSVYQQLEGARHEIEARYVIDGDTVRFALDDYDNTRSLVIDPVISYSTLINGSQSDNIQAIAVDSAGNAYVSGGTNSTTFPTTPGAYSTTLPDGNAAFITKLNATGSALVYSTYLGGTTSGSLALGIAVDGAGAAYVSGLTAATDFPTTAGAFATTSSGQADAFVTKLSPTGASLTYSTYLGGTGNESARAIAVASDGTAYVAGDTRSSDFPITLGAAYGGGVGDAFVTRLNASGTSLLFSRYLGGSGPPTADSQQRFGDIGKGIVVDSAGNAYVTGVTDSPDFPTTAGALFTTNHSIPNNDPSGYADAFVTKLDTAGGLSYSTFLGGSRTDGAEAIAIDSSGNAYVVGGTASLDFPTVSAFDTTYNFGGDAFFAKLNGAGSALSYSTYLGGADGQYDTATGVAIDSAGFTWVSGVTDSASFPTASAIQSASAGQRDAFVAKFNTSQTGAASLPFATYLGGNAGEVDPIRVAVGAAGTYVAGSTLSSSFPTTPGAFATTHHGQDGFVTLIASQAHITGTVFGPGEAPVPGIPVQLRDTAGHTLRSATTSAAGTYSFAVDPGTYVVAFVPAEGSGLALQWYNGQDFANSATPVVVSTADVPNVNGSLEAAYAVTGHVSDQNGAPLAGIRVDVYKGSNCDSCEIARSELTNAQGNYSIEVPAGQTYKVRFAGGTPRETWWNGHLNPTNNEFSGWNSGDAFTVSTSVTTWTCSGSPIVPAPFNNWDGAGVVNDSNEPSFDVASPFCATSQANYHWNNGQGAAPGSIGIRGQTATYSVAALGSPGQATTQYPNGVPNANWYFNPPTSGSGIWLVQPGTWTCTDSSHATWSHDPAVAGALGFCHIEGIPASSQTTTIYGHPNTNAVLVSPRAAYIYNTDLTTARAFQSLLGANGWPVDLIPLSQVAATSFAGYTKILISHDTQTAASGSWGDAAGTQAAALASTGLPIIGLGYGGAHFFERIGIHIGWNVNAEGTDPIAVAVNSADPIWNAITLGSGGAVTLYNGTAPWTGLFSGDVVSGVTPIATSQAAPSYSPITREDPRYLEWGYTLGPTAMTTSGQRLFLNAMGPGSSGTVTGVAECRFTTGEIVTTLTLPGSTVRLFSGSALVAATQASSTDATYSFTGLAPNSTYLVRYAGIPSFPALDVNVTTTAPPPTVTCDVTVTTDADGSGVVPEPTPQLNRLNHLWLRPYHLQPGALVADVIPVPGQSTWYRVTVGPHERLTFRLTTPPTQYTVLAFTDLFAVARQLKQEGQTLASLRLLDGTQDRSAPDLDSPDLDSPDLDSPDLDSPDLDSPDLDSPDLDSPDLDSPDLDSPDLDSPDLDSPDLDSPDLDSADKACLLDPNAPPPGFAGCPVPITDELSTFGSVYVAAQRHGLRAFSAHPGTVPQTIVMNTRDYQGDVYFRVRPHGDLSSSDTFTVSATIDGGAGCTTAPLIQRHPVTPTFAAGARATLILTNTGGSWFTGQTAAAFTAALQLPFAARPEVNGVVVDVNSDPNLHQMFVDWAGSQTCVAEANLVARSVKELVDLYRAHYGLKYLVIAGPDPAIPFFRTRDDAELSKESRYSGGLDALSALETALDEDYVLTDSFYGATGPTTRSGHDFYLSDLAIGRLVETPNDITSYLAKYAAASGGVSVQRAFSSGYGFVSDLASYETNSFTHAGAAVDTLNNDTWSADDLRGALFGAQRYQIYSLQGHGSAERLVPANDGPRILSSEITAVNDGRFAGTFVMSLACHYLGYDLVQGEQLPQTQSISFPEAFVAQGATSVGETGYGYGHDPLLKNGEVVMAYLADELSYTGDLAGNLYGSRGAPVGTALNIAKLRFLNSLADVRGIEAKVINETVVYGAPMFAVKTPSTFARPGATGAVGALPPFVGTLTSADVTQTFTLHQHTLGSGSFFDAGTLNDTATFAFRPIVPAKVVGVQATLAGGGDVVPRGVVFLAGHYTDTAGFTPALAIPATQEGTANPPTGYASASFAPSRLIRLDEFAGDAAVFIPFQFSGTGGPGTARTFDSMHAKIYYSTLTGDDALVDAPGIQSVTLTRDVDGGGNPTGLVRVTVVLSGRTTPGIQDVWATYTGSSVPLANNWASTLLTAGTTVNGRPGTGTFVRSYTGTIDPQGGDPTSVLVDIQAVGGNGLVSYATNGGSHYQIVDQTATVAAPKITPLISISAPANATYRSRINVSATLNDNGTGAPIAGKRVSFKLGGSFSSATTGANGVANATLVANVPPSTDAYRIVASVSEDLDMLAGGVEAPITVSAGPTALTATNAPASDYSDNTAIARLTLTSRGTALPDERVQIDLGARGKVMTYTDKNGNVPFDTLDFGGVGPGTYNATLTYFGNARLGPSTANATIVVRPEHATITVSAAPQPASAPVSFGGAVTQDADGSRGDITKALAHFVVTSEAGLVVSTGDAPVGTDGSWSASRTLPAGVYTVTVNAAGYYASSAASALLAVFDPTTFVTGGGYVTTLATNSTGLVLGKKANFGFNLKYKAGTTIPTGSLLFQATESKVDFKATSFDWLVITAITGGNRAEFQGAGTVNGVAGWQFHAVVTDQGANDTFEIRITNTATGQSYFVSGTSAGGNIVIH